MNFVSLYAKNSIIYIENKNIIYPQHRLSEFIFNHGRLTYIWYTPFNKDILIYKTAAKRKEHWSSVSHHRKGKRACINNRLHWSVKYILNRRELQFWQCVGELEMLCLELQILRRLLSYSMYFFLKFLVGFYFSMVFILACKIVDFMTTLLYRFCPCGFPWHSTIPRNQSAPVLEFNSACLLAKDHHSCVCWLRSLMVEMGCRVTGPSKEYPATPGHQFAGHFALCAPYFWLSGDTRVHRLDTSCPVGLFWGRPCSCQ